MEKGIQAANCVLVVCTRRYLKLVMDGECPKEGKGVKFEALLTYQDIFSASSTNEKFIPVLFSSTDQDFILKPLRSFQYYVVDSERGYEELYRRLTGQPRILKPKGGRRKVLQIGLNAASVRGSEVMGPVSGAEPSASGSAICADEEAEKSARKEVELILDRDFDTYSSADQEHLLSAITELLKTNGDIRITKTRPGSVIVTLELTGTHVGELIRLVEEDKLKECGVFAIRTGEACSGPRGAHVDVLVKIASELSMRLAQVRATGELLDDGATVPFIARYRKEATGTLDEAGVIAIRDRLRRLKELGDRRQAIVKSLEEQDLLTDTLKAKLLQAETMAVLDDIYLPYRPKPRTRATVAREKGLQLLADLIFAQDPTVDPAAQAVAFVNTIKGVASVEEALAGAKDIIAESVNEDQQARAKMRELFQTEGKLSSQVVPGKETEGIKYEDYFKWDEPVAKAPSHRILAMRRGREEGFLRLQVAAPDGKAVTILEGLFVKGRSACSTLVQEAVTNSYKRLLSPSMETEIFAETNLRADEEAIRVFAENLRQLLLAAPLGQKNVLAIDPGFRTGCKVVCLDRQGQLKHHDVVFPHQSERLATADAAKMVELCEKFDIEVIAIGNGTAGRETEAFVKGIKFSRNIPIVMVNESGVSIYSASEVAREEFPDQDVTVRGAVSIGRRLMDPLAELVKIDPKSIGVGQYQHDVDQPLLRQSLDDTVISCVNNVGVEVNTASKQLLQYVSGLGPQLAQNIIAYRNENGPFRSRRGLMEVPRLGAKAFEQAAGFLRIREAANPLDASAVHPESYHVVDKMATDAGCSVADLIKNEPLRKKVRLENYVSDTIGLPTLSDIMQELAKPGRDPRQQFEIFSFAEGVNKIEDIKPGMRLPGIVTNVTAFGAFVDIGVHQEGLVHVSQLADRFVKDPAEVVKVHQKVMVTVLEVDLVKKRISLTMKDWTKAKPTGKPVGKSAPAARRAATPGARPPNWRAAAEP
jgi:uncharacterized protein